jgi:long-chain fatty acid transport protein
VRKTRFWLGIVGLLLLLNSFAMANGFNLSGLGARALAMGGAFVGLADDFSAVFWNPAGIAMFDRKELGFYGSDLIPSGTYKLDWFGQVVADAKMPAQHYFAGLAAYYHPLGKKFVAGFAVYTPSALGTKWNGDDFKLISQGTSYSWKGLVRMITFSPVLAYRLSDRVQIGASLNINRAFFDFKTYAGAVQPYYMSANSGSLAGPGEIILGQYSESLKGWGYGATLGILFRPHDKLSAGVTFKTPSMIRFRGTAHVSNFEAMDLPADSDISRDLTWPLWLAGGIAYKPNDRLTLTADAHFTNWKQVDDIETEFEVLAWKNMLAETGEDVRPMRWKNTTQIRFGAEYMIKPFFLRGGYTWDPSPAPDETMDILIPSHDFDSYSFGIGYSQDGLQVDISLEYSKSRKRVIPIVLPRGCRDGDWRSCFAHSTENLENRPGFYAMKIWTPNISLSYKF